MVVVVLLGEATEEAVNERHAVLLLLALGEKEPDTLDVGVEDRLAELEGAPEADTAAVARAAADAVPAFTPVIEGVAATAEGVAPRGDMEAKSDGVGTREKEPTADPEGATVALPANSPVMEGVDAADGELACELEAQGERESASDTEPLGLGRAVRESDDAPEEEREATGEGVTPPLRVPPPRLGS